MLRLIYNVIKVTGKKLHIKREKAYYTNVQISVQSSYRFLPSSPTLARSCLGALDNESSQSRGERASEPPSKHALLEMSVTCKVKIFSFLMGIALIGHIL